MAKPSGLFREFLAGEKILRSQRSLKCL